LMLRVEFAMVLAQAVPAASPLDAGARRQGTRLRSSGGDPMQVMVTDGDS